jgi:hypothetical protein
VAIIIYYAPQAIRVLRISCFALPGEVSLNQADHVSSKEPACSTRAGSATPALPLTKLMSPVVTRSASGLCLLFLVFPVRRDEVVPVLKA